MFSFKINNSEIIKIRKEIVLFSELFDTLINDFDELEHNIINESISINDLMKINEFLNACDYKILNIEKPFLDKTEKIKEKHLKTDKIKKFYNDLTIDNIAIYEKISGFYGISSLENLLFLKLQDICDKEKINIDMKTKKHLREKNQDLIDKLINNLSYDQVNQLLLSELE